MMKVPSDTEGGTQGTWIKTGLGFQNKLVQPRRVKGQPFLPSFPSNISSSFQLSFFLFPSEQKKGRVEGETKSL